MNAAAAENLSLFAAPALTESGSVASMRTVRKTKRPRAPLSLPREEWDFSGVTQGREYYCWGYEFARESAHLITSYEEDRNGGRHGFDKHGNWRYQLDIFGADDEFLDAVALNLPPGFPDTPYLKLKHVLEKSTWKGWRLPKISNAVHGRNWAPEYRTPEYFVNLHIVWEAPNKQLIQDFGRWLKANRPKPAISRRGKSEIQTCMADLKALGAYRLLKNLTAEEALEHTRQVTGYGLYAKVPDWYEAKARAKKTMQSVFRASVKET